MRKLLFKGWLEFMSTMLLHMIYGMYVGTYRESCTIIPGDNTLRQVQSMLFFVVMHALLIFILCSFAQTLYITSYTVGKGMQTYKAERGCSLCGCFHIIIVVFVAERKLKN